ncbi:MAG: TonB-dependent receptor [Acidobacteria bacterium]|nr:TonB-dependent receptor [Acidobacteriota bacterium]
MLATVFSVLMLSGVAFAQQDSGISGVVSDSSGGVLPGVTVEVSSPALIEGARVVVTDGTGRYNATQLRPGTYSVSFTLAGFSVARREGIVLSAGFTAPVNASLAVGSLEETVTVSGASPTVDVQNVRTQNTISREQLDTLPSGQALSALAALTLGVKMAGIVTQDVGGSQGEMGGVSVHNNRMTDQKITMEGMNTNNSMGTNGGVFHAGQHYNVEAMQEVTLAHNGMTADTETAGAQINYIPKDGGNNFNITGRATFANEDFQSDNVTDALRDRGVTTPPTIRKIWDYGAAVGGPVVQDKLWFFTAHRWWGAQNYQPGAFFNALQGKDGGHKYAPDLNRRAYADNYNRDNSWRATWQASEKDKIAYYGNFGSQCICFLAVSATLDPAAGLNNHLPANMLSQVTWNRVQTNQILFEGGFTHLKNPFSFRKSPGVTAQDLPHIELTTGQVWGAFPSGGLPYTDCDNFPSPICGDSPAGQENGRFSVSYVTGSHAFKAGITMAHGGVRQNGANNELPGFGPAAFLLLAGRPFLIQQFASPKFNEVDFRNIGMFVQDQWRVNNLTLNLGVRFDMFDGWSPSQESPASVFAPAFTTQRIDDTPTWRDVSPRLGVAYDIFGNGKTAVKASAGRYVAAAGAGTVQPTNPALARSTTATRSWNDRNGDFFPDESELGPNSNANFGLPVVNTFFDPDYLTENRGYTWQVSTGVEHELMDGFGVSATYFRTMHYNQTVTDNTLVTPSDYDEFSIVVPTDPRLGAASGTTIGGLYNIKPASFGLTRNLRRSERAFGDETEVFDGVDIAANARFNNGAMLQGGVSIGRTVTNDCFVVDSPQDLYQCEVTTPWWDGNGQIKFAGSYPLPYGIELSAVVVNLPGLPILANGVITSANVQGLGRPLSGGGNVTIPMIQPQTQFEERLTQVDFRLAYVIRAMGRTRVTLDLFNMLNASTIQSRNNTYGRLWGTPTQILGGRLIKIGAQYSF